MSIELKQVLMRVLPFFGVFLGLFIAFKRKKLNKQDLFIQKPNSAKRFILWYVAFLLFMLLTEVVLYHFGLLKVGRWSNTLLPSLIKILGIVVLAPITEELIFRGLLIHKLTQWKVNLPLAIFIQAVIFVLVHSVAFNTTLISHIGKLQIFTDALLFAYAKHNTKSIYTPMAMHATGNSIAVIEQFIL